MYDKPVHRVMSPTLRPIALALYRGNWQSIARSVMKCSALSAIVVELVLKRLREECELLCSRSKRTKLAHSSPDELQSFSWTSVATELKQKAPILYAMLSTVGAPLRPRNIHKGASEESRYPAICTAAAVLLKERCDYMCALQHLVGVILFHGNASKQVGIQ